MSLGNPRNGTDGMAGSGLARAVNSGKHFSQSAFRWQHQIGLERIGPARSGLACLGTERNGMGCLQRGASGDGCSSVATPAGVDWLSGDWLGYPWIAEEWLGLFTALWAFIESSPRWQHHLAWLWLGAVRSGSAGKGVARAVYSVMSLHRGFISVATPIRQARDRKAEVRLDKQRTGAVWQGLM